MPIVMTGTSPPPIRNVRIVTPLVAQPGHMFGRIVKPRTLPAWTVSATARQNFELPGELAGFAQADYQYVDGSWNAFDEAFRVRVPSRDLVNLRAGVRLDRWEVELGT